MKLSNLQPLKGQPLSSLWQGLVGVKVVGWKEDAKEKEWERWPQKTPSHPKTLSYYWDHLPNVQLRTRASFLTLAFPFPLLPRPTNPYTLFILSSLITLRSFNLSIHRASTLLKDPHHSSPTSRLVLPLLQPFLHIGVKEKICSLLKDLQFY